MNIAGIQPVSLIDYPGKPCSIVFTQGCVLRCSYCHNPDLIRLDVGGAMAPEEVLGFLKDRKEIVDAVCISGGEPTIQSGLKDFFQRLKALGFFVKLDTNGIRPDVIEELISESLIDYIAMDLKAPWHKYLEVTKAGSLSTVEACKKTCALIQSSGIDREFRTTIFPGVHTRDDFFQIAKMLEPGEQYFIQKTSFAKTLEPLEQLDAHEQFDIMKILADLKFSFPMLSIDVR